MTLGKSNVPILLLNPVNKLQSKNRKFLSTILRKPVCRELTVKPLEMRALVVNKGAKRASWVQMIITML